MSDRMTTVRIFIDRKDEYRWRLVAKNGRIIADSGEGYIRERDAIRAAKRFVIVIQQEVVRIESLTGDTRMMIAAAHRTTPVRFGPRR